MKWLALLSLCLAGSAHAAEVEIGGWTVNTPAGWNAQRQGDRVVLGHAREPGLLALWVDASATEASLRSDAKEGLSEDGVTLRPRGGVRVHPSKRLRTLFVDLAGTDGEGGALRGRIVAVLAPKGGALAVLALTAPKAFDGLAKRLDAIARSAKVAPKPSGAALLKGPLCTHSGNSEMGRTQRVTFDGRGHVTYGSELVGGGNFVGGSWSAAAGNQFDPSTAGRYEVRGDDVTVTMDGDTMRCRVHFRQRDGRITEVKCGETLWGTSLCE
ncbi:MAG: hypothetical protein RIT81_39900 [Deltaproteobacteria bacterium]